MRSLNLILLLFPLFVGGCSDSSERRLCEGSEVRQPLASSAIVKIEYGTSFGMCAGYCRTWIEAWHDKVVYTKAKWHQPEPVSCSATFTCQIWTKRWTELSSAIDLDAFFALDEVIGCPDCADGGAEWVEITTQQGKHKVTFEYGNPPDVIKPYRNTLFDLKESFNKCE